MKARKEYALAQKQPNISLKNGAQVTHKQPIIYCVNDMKETARGWENRYRWPEIVFKKKNTQKKTQCVWWAMLY